MALVKCPECGREVSDKAKACPGCGRPIAKLGQKASRNTGWLAILGIFLLMVAFGIITKSCGKDINTSASLLNHSSSPSQAGQRISERSVDSLQFSTGNIYVGQLFNNTLKVITVPMVNLNIEKDPKLPGSLQVTKSVTFEGKRLVLVMGRERDPGPYVVRSIVVE